MGSEQAGLFVYNGLHLDLWSDIYSSGRVVFNGRIDSTKLSIRTFVWQSRFILFELSWARQSAYIFWLEKSF